MRVRRSKVSVFGIVSVAALLLCAGSSRAMIDLAHVKGMWLFEEGKGNVSADESGSGLDAKLMSGPKWVEGKFGKGLEFDGKASFVEIPEHENPADAITVTVWAKSTTPTWSAHGFLVEKRDAYIIHPVQGSTNMAWCVVNGAPWNQPNAWDTGVIGPKDITGWHMYTATFDSKTGRWAIYVDGVESSKLDLNKAKLVVEKGPIYIGQDTCCPPRFGAASVDEIAIFDIALTKDQIEEVMNTGLYQSVLAVRPSGKLSTTWGQLRSER